MTRWSGQWLLAVGIGAALGACGDDGGDPAQGASSDSGSDTGAPPDDTSSSGIASEDSTTGDADTGEPPAVVWEFEDVYGVINVDDDDENGTSDWFQVVFDGEDDHSTIAVPPVPEGHTVRLDLFSELEDVRIWEDRQTLAVGSGDGELIESHALTPGPEGAQLLVVFGADNVHTGLTLTLLDAEGTEVAQDTVTLRSSPLVLNHHLQPTEHVWVVDVDQSWGTNASMVAEYAEALGDLFTPVPGNTYGNDVWIQDEVQLATSMGSQGQRADTVIDSIRNRALDPFAEDMLEGPDVNVRTWGNPAQVTTWDSFGNLENSPPVVADGVEYPFGRSYYGRRGNQGLHEDMAAYLISQEIQAPIEFDTLWLCVGHIDEYTSFVPDPDAPKGYKFMIGDVPAAWALLEDLDPATPLPRYGADHGFETVGDILDDTALRNLNDELQADYLDPMRERAIEAFGLDPDDVIRFPSLFETISGCGGGVAALVPGMVNLIVAPLPEETHLFMADPYFRTDVEDQATDPFIQFMNDSLSDELVIHYVDDWDVYHLGLGEVHCGTNMTQTPIANWWEVALHLL